MALRQHLVRNGVIVVARCVLRRERRRRGVRERHRGHHAGRHAQPLGAQRVELDRVAIVVVIDGVVVGLDPRGQRRTRRSTVGRDRRQVLVAGERQVLRRHWGFVPRPGCVVAEGLCVIAGRLAAGVQRESGHRQALWEIGIGCAFAAAVLPVGGRVPGAPTGTVIDHHDHVVRAGFGGGNGLGAQVGLAAAKRGQREQQPRMKPAARNRCSHRRSNRASGGPQ